MFWFILDCEVPTVLVKKKSRDLRVKMIVTVVVAVVVVVVVVVVVKMILPLLLIINVDNFWICLLK